MFVPVSDLENPPDGHLGAPADAETSDCETDVEETAGHVL